MLLDRPEDNKNNDELLNDLRQKLASQSNLEYEEKRNDLNVSKNVFIGAVSGIVLAGIVGWFVLSPQYAADTPDEIPVIRRPKDAIKIQPENPGGMEILNQDKTVYNIIDKKGVGDTPAVETILPPPEEPQLPIIVPEAEPAEPPAPAVPSTEKTIAAAEEIIRAETTPPAKEPVKEIKPEPAPAPAPAPQAPAPQPTPEKISIPAKTPAQPAKAAAGSWQVQLMASTNRNAVAGSWASLSKKYPVLKNQPYEIETADLGAKGIFYRLQAGAFADRSGADALCKEIKSLGGSCIVKKK